MLPDTFANHLPVRIRFGAGVAHSLPDVIAALGGFLGLSKRLRPDRAWFGPRRNRAASRRSHPSNGVSGRSRRRDSGSPTGAP